MTITPAHQRCTACGGPPSVRLPPTHALCTGCAADFLAWGSATGAPLRTQDWWAASDFCINRWIGDRRTLIFDPRVSPRAQA